MTVGDFKKIIANKEQEIIIAVNPTTEGEATRLLIERELASSNILLWSMFSNSSTYMIFLK